MDRGFRNLALLLAVTLPCLRDAPAKNRAQTAPDRFAIAGSVRDAAGNVVPGASVVINKNDARRTIETTTDAQGRFSFSNLSEGIYTVRAKKTGLGDGTRESIRLPLGRHEHLDLVLVADGATTAEASPGGNMPLDDKANFIVAGVTDWSAAGGHGSDAHQKTSEDLARDTRALASTPSDSGAATGVTKEPTTNGSTRTQPEEKLHAALLRDPESFDLNHQLGELYLHSYRSVEAVPLLEAASRIDPANYGNAYDLALAYEASGNLVRAREQVRSLQARRETAELDRLAGALDEQMNDPLAAVSEYERAAKLDGSEESYFDWAAELLLHRAIQPATEIFTRGSNAYPRSERILAGLGAALYAAGSFDKAAEKLCAASDLSPRDTTPYIFLGKMEQAAPQPLACVKGKLARFVDQEPENALANYYYALALVKQEQASGRAGASEQIRTLLAKAVAVEPRFADAYLALGAACAAQGDQTSAIAAYRKAVTYNANLAEAHFRLGQAYKRAGESVKAQEEFEAYRRSSQVETATIERQRREARQFVIVLKAQSPPQ
ncbi:MAG: carboxypeptidase regulatory-like domain-containing protein [Acidobacteria bacterium]|nr:carboxypeptidase regulatory-like domain-containing protein [Acidobacteriota bacterium]